jgi:hypothetical protein
MWIKENDYILFKSIDFTDLKLLENKSVKFALFDLDGTLITSQNGHNPKLLHTDKDPKNYIYLFDKDKYFKIFQMLKDCGFVVGIITNQSRINFKNCTILQKLENILNDFQSILGWKPYVIVNITRVMMKPSSKSFELLYSLFENLEAKTLETKVSEDEICYTVLDNNLVVPNIFYVGDACGIDDIFVPYRFSNVDKDFVFNINQILSKNDLTMNFIRAKDFFGSSDIATSTEKEVVILMGNPGSGKSTTAYKFQKAGYKIIISDELKDKKKILSFVDLNCNFNHSVVIDALNYNSEIRASYIKIAKSYDYKIRILWHIRDGRCYNDLRGLYEKIYYGNTVYFHTKPVPAIVYNVYSSKFETPKEYEIFSGTKSSKECEIFSGTKSSKECEGTIQLVY